MSTRTAPALNVGTSDAQGIETLIALPTANSPTAYVPATLAAAAPVWLHALSTGEYLWLNSIQWSKATVVSPGIYSAYTQDIGGMWSVLNAAKRNFSPVPSYPVTMPLDTVSESCRLVGCASRPPGYLYALSAITDGDVHSALLQHYLVSARGTVQPLTEETLETINGVTFSAGLRLNTPSLTVYGTDANGYVYAARKDWSKVGTNLPTNPYRKTAFVEVLGSSVGWEYFTGEGWSSSGADLSPIKTATGENLSTSGPMSFARYRNQTLLTTVSVSGNVHTGHFWLSAFGRPFREAGTPIDLGIGTEYVGNGIQLMPQLQANPDNSSLAPVSVLSGTPYCYTTLTGTSGSQSLDVRWGLYTYS